MYHNASEIICIIKVRFVKDPVSIRPLFAGIAWTAQLNGFVYHVNDDDGEHFYETLPIDEAIEKFKLYNTKDILLPQYLQPSADLDAILELFSMSTNREVFITLMRTDNPYMGYDKCKSIYTLLKDDNIELVKKILRII